MATNGMIMYVPSGSMFLSAWNWIKEVAATVDAAAARQYRFAETYTELAVLSDRDLADIGVERDDIERLAWRAAEAG